MKPDEFDLQLMDEMSQLPPPAPEVHDYTPWQASIRKIIWGMVLITFRFEFFSLQYLLPLLGATLLYLGYRSLRKSDPWFTLCWGLSAFLLVIHIAYDILTATPIMAQVTQNTVLNNSLTALMVVANAVILFTLRAGIRRRFVSITGEKPKDWLGRGLVAYLLSLAIALWSTLAPATEPSLFFGQTITDPLLHYGRGIAVIVLQIYLLICIFRQSESLVGQGYDIVPAPVRLPGKVFVLGVFLLVLLAILPALWLSCHLPIGETQEVTAPLSGDQTAVRNHLVELGLPQKLADTLDEAELERCKDAYAVQTGSWENVNLTNEEGPQTEGHDILVQLEDTQARFSVWLVFLPQGQVRWYYFFQYDTLPALRLQEQFSLDVSSNDAHDDYTAALLWQEGETTYLSHPQVQLAGGQTAEELNEEQQWWYEEELERLGHLHYAPYISFSIPQKATMLGGYLAYTADASEYLAPENTYDYNDSTILVLRHQTSLFHYPFCSIDDVGGSGSLSAYGPIHSAYGHFYHSAPFPQ